MQKQFQQNLHHWGASSFWLFTLPFTQRQADLEQQPYVKAVLKSHVQACRVRWLKQMCWQLPTKAGLEFFQSLESWCASSRWQLVSWTPVLNVDAVCFCFLYDCIFLISFHCIAVELLADLFCVYLKENLIYVYTCRQTQMNLIFVLKDICQIMIPGSNSYFYILVGHIWIIATSAYWFLCDKIVLSRNFRYNLCIVMVPNNKDNWEKYLFGNLWICTSKEQQWKDDHTSESEEHLYLDWVTM